MKNLGELKEEKRHPESDVVKVPNRKAEVRRSNRRFCLHYVDSSTL